MSPQAGIRSATAAPVPIRGPMGRRIALVGAFAQGVGAIAGRSDTAWLRHVGWAAGRGTRLVATPAALPAAEALVAGRGRGRSAPPGAPRGGSWLETG